MKTVVIRAQQKWECLTITKFSENAFQIAANEAGQQGWELVSATVHKDGKGTTCWTAFLKRPSAGQGPKSAATENHDSTAQPVAASDTPGWNLDGEAFEVKKE